MAQQNKPVEIEEFGGVVTVGAPGRRPHTTASYMNNMRLLPGMLLRLFGGRRVRYFESDTDSYVMGFHEYRDPTYTGYSSQMRQWNDGAGSAVVKWQWFSLVSWALSDVLTVSQAYDSGYTRSRRGASLNLRDRVLLYNGLGVRDGTVSKPAISAWIPSVGESHYFGLDAYCPGGTAPTAGTSAGTGLDVLTNLQVWVGLYNSRSGHYSNAVYCGSIAAGTYAGVVVSNLNRLSHAYNTATEQGDLNFVFYFSIDGSGDATNLPQGYLHMATSGIAPYTEVATATTSSAMIPNRDKTKYRPTRNNPPRPMRWLVAVQGRLYGAWMLGGGNAGSWNDGFNYTASSRYYAGVAYSEPGADAALGEQLGNPEESWPLDNFKATPNYEVPLVGLPAPDGYRLFTITPSACFLYEEASDGVHETTDVSRIHGIAVPETAILAEREVDGGKVKVILWVDQRNQICMLEPGRDAAQVLSTDYQTLLSGKTPRCATYTLDPLNHIDRYEVYFTDGTALVHDFNANTGYTFAADITAAQTLTSALNKQFHMVAKRHMYSQAGQPENGKEIMVNEDYTELGATTETAITGSWYSQWLAFGDKTLRKYVPKIHVDGDSANTAVSVRTDFDDSTAVSTTRETQDQTNSTGQRKTTFMHQFRLASALWAYFFKFRLTLTGLTDSSEYHPTMDEYGNGSASTHFLGLITSLDIYANREGDNR